MPWSPIASPSSKSRRRLRKSLRRKKLRRGEQTKRQRSQAMGMATGGASPSLGGVTDEAPRLDGSATVVVTSRGERRLRATREGAQGEACANKAFTFMMARERLGALQIETGLLAQGSTGCGSGYLIYWKRCASRGLSPFSLAGVLRRGSEPSRVYGQSGS